MPILEDGQLFERYRVHKWLGSGIAGESYEAEDRILQRKVTLKLIHPWATLPDSARRQFFREMQGISLLNHPYLATVLDYGETEGHIYVARRYVSSGSLLGTNGRLWFHAPLPVTDAFKYAHQLARALQYIHQHGYLHGSFTFANVLVLRGPNSEHDTDYAPFLMADIGLATFVRRFGHPRIETLPVSASPEQLGKRVTPASDQFALAVLLYFWLAGRPPYLGTPGEVEYQKLSETITPLSILNPGVTLEQDSIILRALTVYPEDRYPSVLAFTEELIASLSSANRLYAPSLASQPETPSMTKPRVTQDNVLEDKVEVESQAASAPHTQATTADAEEVPAPTTPSQTQTEPYRSALEELLSLPQTNTRNVPFNEEDNKAPDEENEESLERVQQEHFTLFPILPETPPVEEIPAPADLAFITSAEIIEQETSKKTGPLAAEPNMDALYNQADEPAAEMPLDVPDSTNFTSSDELPPALENASATSQPDDPSSIDEEETPTLPRENFTVSEEGLVTFSLDGSSAFSQFISPIILPDESLLANEEDAPTVPLEKSATSANEDMAALSFDNPTLFEEANRPQSETFQTEEDARSLAEQAIVLKEDAHLLAEQTDILEEDARSLAEQANLLKEDAHLLAEQTDMLEEDARSLTEQTSPQSASQPTFEEITPTVPRKDLASASTESTLPLSPDEPALPENVCTTPPQAEIVALDEDPRIDGTQLADMPSGTLASTLEMEITLQPPIGSPIQEAYETSGTTYPPIDEAIIAPRLIISSPYTSSFYEFLLVSEETNIGRAGASNLYLEQDNLTSRHHALLRRIGERALIFDKHSHNGVFLNGQKIEAGRGHELADGDHISIGNYELIFRSAPAGHVPQLI